jgi:hypothetical protein
MTSAVLLTLYFIVKRYCNKMESVLKKELSQTITDMCNEFELSFDYIKKSDIDNIREIVNNGNVHIKIYEQLKDVESNIFGVIKCTGKIKKQQYDFLNNINFLGKLDLSKFAEEGKNTKQVIVKYLYNMYMPSKFLEEGIDINQDNIKIFVESIVQAPEQVATEPKKKSVVTSAKNNPQALIEDLMKNPQIMDIANEITSDLQNQSFDPMELMSSLMLGKPNAKLNNMIKKISDKIENKIETGELNKQELEAHANQFISTIDVNSIQKILKKK